MHTKLKKIAKTLAEMALVEYCGDPHTYPLRANKEVRTEVIYAKLIEAIKETDKLHYGDARITIIARRIVVCIMNMYPFIMPQDASYRRDSAIIKIYNILLETIGNTNREIDLNVIQQ
jgi:hypothetical protein